MTCVRDHSCPRTASSRRAALSLACALIAGCGGGQSGTGGRSPEPGQDVTAPTVSIASPTASATYTATTASVTLSGHASDDVGVARVTWSNDQGGSGTATGTATWSASIALHPGQNVLRVAAVDAAGNRGEASLQVVYDPSAPTALGSRPNDGSGYWPDFSNTGYRHTPANAGGLGLGAYPGKLADYQSGMSATRPFTATFADGSVIAYKRFLASKVSIYGDDLTFVGCLFEGTDPNDNLVQIYADTKITFLYSTFKPSAYATPPGNDGTVSSAHSPPGTPFDQSWQLVTTMREAVAVMDHNDVWGNAGLEMVTGFPDRPSVWTNNYIHDAADTAHDVYHHDGIGPQSEGNGGPMVIDHNTIASLGNTNALALQGDGIYDHVVFTNNYISGYGYAVSIGVKNNATNVTFTGNVFSAELYALYGPLYGGLWGGSARGSTWRDNRYQVRAGDGNVTLAPADDARYWWPTDDQGHATDYGD